MLKAVLDLFFPPPFQCPLCSKPFSPEKGRFFCRSCHDTFTIITSPFCPICGKPFIDSGQGSCAACMKARPLYLKARSAGVFAGGLQESIYALKYQKKRFLAQPLAKLLYQAIRQDTDFLTVDMIVPVPLHRRKLQERGFNQAELLAAALGNLIGKPVVSSTLLRRFDTAAQSKLHKPERLANLQGAFVVLHPERVSGRRVMLVDDIMTTGATVESCTAVLLKAGAREVLVAALATGQTYSFV